MEKKGLDPNAWMVTFSDLVMLLLTFFVLLLTMSSMDAKKLKETFMQIGGDAAGVLELTSSRSVTSMGNLVKKYQSTDGLLVVHPNLMLNMLIPTEGSEKEVEELVADINKLINISDDERGIIVTFQEDILFLPGSAQLKKEAFPFLTSIARAIASCPNDIIIMGHTDNIPVKSDLYESNWALSYHRGISVLEYFLEKQQLEPLRFTVGGYGASRPLHLNNTQKNRALNRRVEIIFKHI